MSGDTQSCDNRALLYSVLLSPRLVAHHAVRIAVWVHHGPHGRLATVKP